MIKISNLDNSLMKKLGAGENIALSHVLALCALVKSTVMNLIAYSYAQYVIINISIALMKTIVIYRQTNIL